MSMKSMTTRPPILRRRNCRAISRAASRLVLRRVSSRSCAAHEAPGVHVDGGEGLGGAEQQVAAALEPDLGSQQSLPVDLQPEMAEQGLRVGIEFHPVFIIGIEGFQIILNFLEGCLIIHQNPVDLREKRVPGRPAERFPVPDRAAPGPKPSPSCGESSASPKTVPFPGELLLTLAAAGGAGDEAAGRGLQFLQGGRRRWRSASSVMRREIPNWGRVGRRPDNGRPG